ncbi:MAG: hypothetical protein LUQ71_09170 [Methanoregula sp.]|nr:hypothetical protein [Methanoregula sp.]
MERYYAGTVGSIAPARSCYVVHQAPQCNAPQQTGLLYDGGSAAILAAVVAGICSMMHVEFLLWDVALAALFLIPQLLSWIKERMEIPECP